MLNLDSEEQKEEGRHHKGQWKMEMALETAESGNRVILWPQRASETPMRCSANRCLMSE